MDKARVKQYIERVGEDPDNPIRIARCDEGSAVFEKLMFRKKESRLIILPGVIYIAPSVAAVEEILRRLDKEKAYYRDREKVPEKEREIEESIKGIKELLETGKRKFVSRNAIAGK